MKDQQAQRVEPVPAALEPPRSYALGPFRFESEIALPELPEGDWPGLRGVSVRLAAPPAEMPDAVRLDEVCTLSTREFLLSIPDVARFYAGHGRDVRVDPAPGADVRDLRLYLLGSVFGALCHQHGLLPLHASAVETGGQVTAFLGVSGAGKSTLAAFLGRRGYRIVSDDICLLEPVAGGGHRVIPVAGWLKLWRTSLDVLGEEAVSEHRIMSREDKFRVYLDGQAEGDARLRLKHVVLLDRPAEDQAPALPTLEPLAAATAIVALMQMTYLDYIPEATGGQHQLFAQCAAALSGAPAYRLLAPHGWDHMEAVLELIERRLLRSET